ncbi:hypothetical protein BDB01DRAFT_840898 [Pilobolus umbonatus]|nr:hypothetical protein BDB01DRAFT_840898 [Pilobolus umbonatus]
MNTERIIKSANWIRVELLVRLAHRIRDFQQLPFFVGTNPHIEYVYKLYWGAFESIRQFPSIETHDDNMKFCQLLKDLLEDGLVALPKLAQGLSESAAYYPPGQNDLDLFLNRVLRSRISRRVLAEQHLALTEACENQFDHAMGFGDGYVGIIFVHCSAREIVSKAKTLVYQHIERYMDGPERVDPPAFEVNIQQHGSMLAENDRPNEILFAYIPEQLEHILYELFDNAARYTMLKYPNGNYPPIQVTVSANDTDVYFRVSDQGGGMSKEKYDHLWSYQSRAQIGDCADFKQIQKVPASIDGRVNQASEMGQRHLGMGLTMSRLYAEYWGGELQIITMDGHGTDAYVRIPRLGTKTENLGIERHEHPVYYNHARSGSSITGPTKKKKIPKEKAPKKGHEVQLPKLSTKHIELVPPEQQLLDTSLTSESFSGNGWSESRMIRS